MGPITCIREQES